jgi:hypothetical protein
VLFAIGPFAGQPLVALFGKPSQPVGNLSYQSRRLPRPADLITRGCANEIDDGAIIWSTARRSRCTGLDDAELRTRTWTASRSDNASSSRTATNRTTIRRLRELRDADFGDDGGVRLLNFGAFKAAFATSSGGPGYDPDIDLDSDSGIGIFDFRLFRFMFDQPVGPRLACAGRAGAACL